MYKISAPIMNSSIKEDTKEKYLKGLLDAKIERVFLVEDIFTDFSIQEIKENVKFFQDNGIEPVIWISTIGHGGPVVKETQNQNGWGYIRSFLGENIQDVYCPLDQNFTDYVSQKIALLATTGVKKIMLDDDYRLSQHSSDLCCVCDKHLQRISEILGEKVDIDILKEKGFVGKGNKYRDAYLKAMGDSLRDMARKIRSAVDDVDKSVNITIASAWSVWDSDGCTAMEICEILAGDNPKFLRLHSAPYWVNAYGMPLASTIENAKMFASFCKGKDVEIFSEGDTYPRPRYKVPASYLELYDTALRLDGNYDGILKYTFDYNGSFDYEKGYLERHLDNFSNSLKIEEIKEGGITDGVRVYVYPNTLKDKEIYPDYDRVYLNQSPYSSGDIFSSCGIPTTYDGDGVCSAVFGENAKYIPKEALKNGAILDAVSAKILFERGIDVGIEKIKDFSLKTVRVEFFDEEKVCIEERCRLLDADYKEEIIGESFTAKNGAGQHLSFGFESERGAVTSYRYQNADGQKFLVLCFSLEETNHKSVLKCSYERQARLIDGIEWISGKKLPAVTYKHPGLYLVCKRKGDCLIVGVFNCFADYAKDLKVRLDGEYKKITPIVGDAKLEKDTVTILGKLSAFDYAVFAVEK